jgi:hypothetical protein
LDALTGSAENCFREIGERTRPGLGNSGQFVNLQPTPLPGSLVLNTKGEADGGELEELLYTVNHRDKTEGVAHG